MYRETWYRVPSHTAHHHTLRVFKNPSYISSYWTHAGIRVSCIPWMVKA